MRKFILVLVMILALAPMAWAVDWSRYDSKFDNVMVMGYKTQPGYFAFVDKAGTTQGYMYAHSDGNLYYQCKTANTPAACRTGIDLTTTKLGTVGGEIKVNNAP